MERQWKDNGKTMERTSKTRTRAIETRLRDRSRLQEIGVKMRENREFTDQKMPN